MLAFGNPVTIKPLEAPFCLFIYFFKADLIHFRL